MQSCTPALPISTLFLAGTSKPKSSHGMPDARQPPHPAGAILPQSGCVSESLSVTRPLQIASAGKGPRKAASQRAEAGPGWVPACALHHLQCSLWEWAEMSRPDPRVPRLRAGRGFWCRLAFMPQTPQREACSPGSSACSPCPIIPHFLSTHLASLLGVMHRGLDDWPPPCSARAVTEAVGLGWAHAHQDW